MGAVQVARDVSSVLLSETIISGRRRAPTMASSSRATRRPESDVSTASARHSRVKSSTTTRTRKRLPSASMPRQSPGSTAGSVPAAASWAPACPAPACGRRASSRQPLFPVEPEQLLVVELYAFPPQQDVQSTIAEPPPLKRQVLQPRPHGGIVRTPRRIAVGLQVEPAQTAGTPLRVASGRRHN